MESNESKGGVGMVAMWEGVMLEDLIWRCEHAIIMMSF